MDVNIPGKSLNAEQLTVLCQHVTPAQRQFAVTYFYDSQWPENFLRGATSVDIHPIDESTWWGWMHERIPEGNAA